MTTPYYQDDHVTLYHGDCLTDLRDYWLDADVLVCDPPYGRSFRTQGGFTNSAGQGSSTSRHIANDKDTAVRDGILEAWGGRPAIVFGDLLIAPPAGTKQALVWRKPEDAGVRGATAGFRRDLEAVYLCGKWPSGIGGRSSVLRYGDHVAGPTGPAAIHGHPNAKPESLMAALVALTDGVIADPCAGSGATLVAARNLGRKAIGVELEERHCETVASRLSQCVLDFGAIA